MGTSAAGVLAAPLGGEGWSEVVKLGLAFILSAVIGLEREWRNKSAGLRTHTLVGVGAALFMLVSKHGFGDVLAHGLVVLDPSRMAAQIVSGIGFIGGGVIFVRRDAVRGLTTAAVVWVVAAVGAAAGAGLPILATGVAAGHFLVVFGLTPIANRLPRPARLPFQLRLTYLEAAKALPEVLEICRRRKFTVSDVSVDRSAFHVEHGHLIEAGRDNGREHLLGEHVAGSSKASAVLSVRGTGSIPDLVAEVAALPGIVTVSGGVTETPNE
ncbi:MgtC/SapB family protein [Sphaerimonospora mesophila]|uniref:MgtC/SapB family protein n=1 Tax=Sphaerimonospora mesophila TaxID=37483 RepID=UPI0006E33482